MRKLEDLEQDIKAKLAFLEGYPITDAVKHEIRHTVTRMLREAYDMLPGIEISPQDVAVRQDDGDPRQLDVWVNPDLLKRLLALQERYERAQEYCALHRKARERGSR